MSKTSIEVLPCESRGQAFLYRLSLVSAIGAYVCLFYWALKLILVPIHGGLGFQWVDGPDYLLVTAVAFALIPVSWVRSVFARPSQIAFWLLYVTVYVPGLIIAATSGYDSSYRAMILMFSLFLGFGIIALSHYMPLLKLRSVAVPPEIYWGALTLAFITACSWIIFVFRGQMRLVSFVDVLDMRYASRETLSASGSLVGYASGLLSGAVNPLLMAFGLQRRRPLMFVIGAGAQVLIYSTTAMKAILLSILFMLLFHFALKKQPEKLARKMVLGVVAVVAAHLVLASLLVEFRGEGFIAMLTYVVLMRTLGIPGLLLSQYDNFFYSNPLTYWSHIHGFDLFLRYPYKDAVGFEVAKYYLGNFNVNASAGLWHTDGIAAAGPLGIVIISCLCCGLFWLIDSVCAKQDLRFASLAFTYSALNICDNPLFTTLSTGGLIALMLMLYLMPVSSKARPLLFDLSRSSGPHITPAAQENFAQ